MFTLDQSHVFYFKNRGEVGPIEVAKLEEEFLAVDAFALPRLYDVAKEWYSKQLEFHVPYDIEWDAKDLPTFDTDYGMGVSDKETIHVRNLALFRERGEKVISTGIAVMILAGEFENPFRFPRMMMDIGLLSRKSILQILFERLQRLSHMVVNAYEKCEIVIYIMVYGKEDHEVIRDYLIENEYFGWDKDDVVIFKQTSSCVMDAKGFLMMTGKQDLALRPSGSGGFYEALRNQGILPDMITRGLRGLYVVHSDNPLTLPGDPMLIGSEIRTRLNNIE